MPKFQYLDQQPEQHRIRRGEILRRHPEVRSLYGFSRLTSAVMIGIVLAQLVAAWMVQQGVEKGNFVGTWWFILPLAYFFGGTLTHWVGMGVHESSHDLVAKTEAGNRAVALIANIIVPFPSSMSFRRYHMKHHSHLGIVSEDNDLAMDPEINWVGNSPWRKLTWLIFYLFFAALARGFLKKPSRWEIFNVAVTFITDALIIHFIGWSGIGYLALSTFLGYGLHPAAAHFIHEHYIWKKGQETYSYYGPLNWVTFNVGYHNEHHDLMWIPCWKLPEIRRIAPEFYEEQETHRSWTWVLFHFIFNREIGHHSRIVRPRSTLQRSGSTAVAH